MWLESGGKMLLKDIAAALSLGETQIRKWKSQDKWAADLNSNVTNESNSNVTKRKERRRVTRTPSATRVARRRAIRTPRGTAAAGGRRAIRRRSGPVSTRRFGSIRWMRKSRRCWTGSTRTLLSRRTMR
ncbi:phage terminase small subunit-related protein [Cohnella cellulosilytica]|uniref:phage terminase small subunit-related protein n=1 Tax=Cohnella cellulosilytica TaxID=986710 RepID=UPI003612C82E